jgi:hypothetical protein
MPPFDAAARQERHDMASFAYTTIWHFKSPLALVWNELADPLDWPSWWRSMERVDQTTPGDALGVGAVHRYTVKGALPYRLAFDMRTTVVETHSRIEGTAMGELEGQGVWTFSEEEDESMTHVRYDWSVVANKPWMKLLAPVARPLYRWNHDAVMRAGEQGLRARLATR